MNARRYTSVTSEAKCRQSANHAASLRMSTSFPSAALPEKAERLHHRLCRRTRNAGHVRHSPRAANFSAALGVDRAAARLLRSTACVERRPGFTRVRDQRRARLVRRPI